MKSKPSENLLLAAQEIAFAKALASNEKSLRDRALKKLKKWLASKCTRNEEFTEEGLMRIWKGLFYCVWMSDKPLVQEDCVELISNLIHCFENYNDTQMFIRCFFHSMSQAWFGLDGHRMDKYLMLVRRFLRQIFESACKLKWEKSQVELLSKNLTLSLSLSPVGLILHMADIYMEELAKIGRGELSSETVTELLKPFTTIMGKSTDNRLLKQITNNIFFYLLRQSEEGIKHHLKFQAWKQLGFPGGDINLMEEVERDSDEEIENFENEEDEVDQETALDIRAGRVNVEIPPIEFDAKAISEYLNNFKKSKDVTNKARKQLNHIIRKFTHYSSGKYPLGTHKYEAVEKEDVDEVVQEAATRLHQFEAEIIDEKPGKPNSKKSRKSSSSWEVSVMDTEEEGEEEISQPNTSGNWEVTESISQINNPMSGQTEEADDDEEMNTDEDTDKEDGNVNENTVEETKQESIPDSTKNKDRVKKEKRKQKNKNTTSSKNEGDAANDWGDTWDFSDDGETEIVIQPKRKKIKTITPKNPKGVKMMTTNVLTKLNMSTGSEKRVEFVLNRNSFQAETEYKNSVKRKPSIPFDAEKKPIQGVLKSTPINSPINPFYNLKDSIKK